MTIRPGLSKKQLAAMSKWASKPRDEASSDQPQRDLWDALNQYCIERGGAITSPKWANPLTLEVPVESPLADKLTKLGYDLIFCERATRIGGAATPEYSAWWRHKAVTSGHGFRTVDVYSIRLPSK